MKPLRVLWQRHGLPDHGPVQLLDADTVGGYWCTSYPVDARLFKEEVHVIDEFKTTLMSWETGAKKECVYKIPSVQITTEGQIRLGYELLGHTPLKETPKVSYRDQLAVRVYCTRKQIQEKHRRGGLAPSLVDNNSIKRYPKVRGLRFSPETSTYSDRDRSSALTIARLQCMELFGQGRPLPFCRDACC